jgi:hypothetical protein
MLVDGHSLAYRCDCNCCVLDVGGPAAGVAWFMLVGGSIEVQRAWAPERPPLQSLKEMQPRDALKPYPA